MFELKSAILSSRFSLKEGGIYHGLHTYVPGPSKGVIGELSTPTKAVIKTNKILIKVIL